MILNTVDVLSMIGTISQFATFGLVGYGLYDYKLSLKERRIKNYFEIAKRFSSDKQIQEILNLLEKKRSQNS